MRLSYTPPPGWDFVTVGDLAKPEKGSIRIGPFGSALKKHEYSENGIRVLGIEDVHPNQFLSNRCKYIPDAKFCELSQYEVSDGDVLVTNMGTVGRACAVPAGTQRSIISSHLIKVSLNRSRADPNYLCWMLNYSPLVVAQIRAKSHGAIMAGFNSSLLKSLRIPLPPLAEQKRIAGILDAADALRAKRREAFAQLDILLQSTFLDTFGDPVTNPMGWEVRSLGELAVKKPNNGVFRRNPEYSENLDSGLRVVWVEELFRGNCIDISESRRLEASQTEIEKYGLLPGDLLFCRSSLKLGGIAYNNVFLGEREEALFECHLIRVSPRTDVVNPMFLNLQLRTVPMRALLKSKSKTATMTTIDQKALSSVEVVVPPIGLQSRFAAVVDSVEQQKARQHAHLTELDTLFASLQSRAFRGDL
ncbi:MAG: restriction endonuclease subunit S [Acidobacteria bacterium]|nr:restriction endonuclease subunit S [Acidobacteriota bacterium]